MSKYNITRRTLSNWVKRGIIEFTKTPSGRYIYIDVLKKESNNE